MAIGNGWILSIPTGMWTASEADSLTLLSCVTKDEAAATLSEYLVLIAIKGGGLTLEPQLMTEELADNYPIKGTIFM